MSQATRYLTKEEIIDHFDGNDMLGAFIKGDYLCFKHMLGGEIFARVRIQDSAGEAVFEDYSQ